MRLRFAVYIFLIISSYVNAQQDSAVFTSDIKDGIYLTYADFRSNNAISKEQIISDADRNHLEFVGKLMNEDKLTYNRGGGVESVDPKTIWGFFQNKTLYVNFREEFFRVPVFGSICYLIATVPAVNTGFYDPNFGYVPGNSRTKEIREFIMNFYDGQVVEFGMDRAEELLSRDPMIYKEFKDLSRRKRKEQVYRYIRKYNDAHPVHFLRTKN